MSNRASPVVGFGFSLGDGTGMEIPGWEKLVEDTYEENDKDWPVELVPHGYHDYRFWFVAIRGSVLRDAEWGSMIRVETIAIPSTAQVADAKAWCDERKIPWTKPEMVAMATYD